MYRLKHCSKFLGLKECRDIKQKVFPNSVYSTEKHRRRWKLSTNLKNSHRK